MIYTHVHGHLALPTILTINCSFIVKDLPEVQRYYPGWLWPGGPGSELSLLVCGTFGELDADRLTVKVDV